MAAVDIVRLLASFDLASNPILSSTAIAEMWSNPPEVQDDNTYLGWNGVPEKVKGFRIRQGKFLIHPDVQLFHHNGATTGAIAFAMRREDGLSIAVVFNKNTIPGLYIDPHGLELSDIATEVADVAPWPTWDLFPQYDLPPFLPRRGYQARLKVQT